MSAINQAARGDLQSLTVSEETGWSKLQRKKREEKKYGDSEYKQRIGEVFCSRAPEK